MESVITQKHSLSPKQISLLSGLCGLIFLFVPSLYAAETDSVRRAARPRVGLVLSGGGAKGIAHVGILKVLEELGIPIDYIGGTSMGSIVGGLYALGYTSVQLETYMRETDWENLLTGKVLRRHVSIYEKGERKRYWLQVPIKGRKLEFPLGILTGQNVSNLFTELASPAYAETDFSKFTIPFLCVATDLKSGKEVVLEHGNLAKAMRASMAIPSVFTPEIIDGKHLYDGGLTNNFPADLVRNKGVDILIGVDVTEQNDQSELGNIYQVMEQVVFLASLSLKEANKKLCKILITPNLTEYNASNFNAVDSLVVRGERAARLHYPELKALADSLRTFEPDRPTEQKICPQPLHSFYVNDVSVNGLQRISKEYLLQKLELDFPCEITFAQLEHAMDKVKGTQMFHTIVYQLNPLPNDAVELQFDCVEQSENLIRAGLQYDKEYKTALLLNLSLRNVLTNNSRSVAELSIGENPAFTLSYLFSPRLQPVATSGFVARLAPDRLFNINGYRLDAYNYVGKRRTTPFTLTGISAGGHLTVNPSVNSLVGVGVTGSHTVIRTQTGGDIDYVRSTNLYLTGQIFYEHDTYNEDYFPTRGSKLRIEGMYHKGISRNVRSNDGLPSVMFRSDFAGSPNSRWTIHWGVDAGSIFGSDVPQQYLMSLGGAPGKHLRNDMTFVGMHFMQECAKNAWVAHLNHQVRLWNNIYVTFRGNVGKTDNQLIELFGWKNLRFGGGISAQYNSVAGPIGFTVSRSTMTRSLLGAINFGFWF